MPVSSALPCLLLVAALLCSDVASAGAWVKPPREGYFKLGSASFLSDHNYNEGGLALDSYPYLLRVQTVYSYVELGVLPQLMVVGYLPWVAATNQFVIGYPDAAVFQTIGLGDAQLGLQLDLSSNEAVPFAVRVDVKQPLYAPQQTESRRVPALGDGQLDATLVLLAGASLDFGAFVTAEAGYRLRSEGITDAVVGAGTAGVFLLQRRLLPMWNFAVVYTLLPPSGGGEAVGKGFVTTGAACMVMLHEISDGLALEVGVDLVVGGRNTAGGISLQWGVSRTF